MEYRVYPKYGQTETHKFSYVCDSEAEVDEMVDWCGEDQVEKIVVIRERPEADIILSLRRWKRYRKKRVAQTASTMPSRRNEEAMRLEHLLYHDGMPVETNRFSGWPFALICFDAAEVERQLSDDDYPDALIGVRLRIGKKEIPLTRYMSLDEWREWMSVIPERLRVPERSHAEIIAAGLKRSLREREKQEKSKSRQSHP